jgi:hypothetical protein
MNAVENKMNTEMNTEIITPVIVAAATETKKVKVNKQKKTETSAMKPAPKKPLVVDDELVVENVEAVKVATEVVVDEVITEKIIEKVDAVVDAVEDAVNDTTAEVSVEVDELEVLRRQQLAIAKQIEMIETFKKVKKNITAMRKILIDNRTAEIIRLKEKLLQQQEELDALVGLDDDELMGTISGNIQLETELGLNKPVVVARPPTARKPAAKSESDSDEETEKKTRVKYDRDTQFADMPTGLELLISYKDKKATYKKTDTGLERNGKAYQTLHQAGKAFYADIGVEKKTFNAWSEFKVMVNGKRVAIADM